MSKVVKKTALIIAIIVAVCAAIWGIIVAINSFKRESVKVFTVSDIAMTDYWGDTSETYGTVSTDNLQKVLVSDSQTISNIYVKEGQSVSKGDKLLAYDSTLSELDVEKATIELNKLKLQLDNAKKELEELNNTKPSEGGDEGQGGGSGEVLVQPAKLSGSGTEDDPYVYLWGSDSTLDEETKLEMLSGADRAYVVMVEREGNRTDGQVLNAYGICLIKNGEHINISFFQPENITIKGVKSIIKKCIMRAENIANFSGFSLATFFGVISPNISTTIVITTVAAFAPTYAP